MASYIKKGESLLIPFRNGQSIADSQLKPRMYKTMQAFEKSFPWYYLGTAGVELVEYAEVVHGHWAHIGENCCVCSVCHKHAIADYYYCPECGAKMDGGNDDG